MSVSKGFDLLIDADLSKARVSLADRGYDSDHVQHVIDLRGGTAVIPSKANRKVLPVLDTMF